MKFSLSFVSSYFVCIHSSLAVKAVATSSSSSSSSSEVSTLKKGWENVKTFTALTKPLPLYPGEVTNTFHKLAIPPGPIAISEFSADVVELRPTINEKGEIIGNEIVPVPLSDAYLHHHVVVSNHKNYEHMKHWWSPMKPSHVGGEPVSRGVGFGAGTESRGTLQKFPFPYAFTTVEGEDELIANVHVINTRKMSRTQAHHCLECPCTLQDLDLRLEGVDYPTPAPISKNHQNKHSKATSTSTHHEAPVIPKSLMNASTSEFHLLESVMKRRRHWEECNDELLGEHNTACFNQTYYGGLICCEHGEFCLDEKYFGYNSKRVDRIKQSNDDDDDDDDDDVMKALNADGDDDLSVYYLRYTLKYTDFVPGETQPLFLAACCDASGNETMSGNIEYDIPQLCDPKEASAAVTTPEDACVHTVSTLQMLHGATGNGVFGTGNVDDDGEKGVEVDVVYIVGHLHRGGIEVSVYRYDETDEEAETLLCKSVPIYGDGQPGEIGNEPGYINAMSTCTFDPPLRMNTTDRLRVVGKYNATEAHTGVMSLVYVAMAEVPSDDDDNKTGGFFHRFRPIAIFVAMMILVTAVYRVLCSSNNDRAGDNGVVNNFINAATQRRWGYQQIPNNNHATSLSV